jgi:hypothetical protein
MIQSRKFLNCNGIPKSSALRAAITAWRSSRFLAETRTWSPWVCDETPLVPRSLTNLLICRALASSIPAASRTRWRAVPLAPSSTFS